MEDEEDARFGLRVAYAIKPGSHGLFFPGVSFTLVEYETKREVFLVEPSPNNVTGDIARVKPIRDGDANDAQAGGRHRRSGRGGGARKVPGSMLLRDEFGWCTKSMPVVFIDEASSNQMLVHESDTRCFGYAALCGLHMCAHKSRVYVLRPPIHTGPAPGKHWDPNSRRGGSVTKQEREVIEMSRSASLDKARPEFVVEARSTRKGVEIHRIVHHEDMASSSHAKSSSDKDSKQPWTRVLVATMRHLANPVAEGSPLIGMPWNVPAKGWKHFEVRVDESQIDATHAISIIISTIHESYCCLGCSSFRMGGIGMGVGRMLF